MLTLVFPSAHTRYCTCAYTTHRRKRRRGGEEKEEVEIESNEIN